MANNQPYAPCLSASAGMSQLLYPCRPDYRARMAVSTVWVYTTHMPPMAKMYRYCSSPLQAITMCECRCGCREIVAADKCDSREAVQWYTLRAMVLGSRVQSSCREGMAVRSRDCQEARLGEGGGRGCRDRVWLMDRLGVLSWHLNTPSEVMSLREVVSSCFQRVLMPRNFYWEISQMRRSAGGACRSSWGRGMVKASPGVMLRGCGRCTVWDETERGGRLVTGCRHTHAGSTRVRRRKLVSREGGIFKCLQQGWKQQSSQSHFYNKNTIEQTWMKALNKEVVSCISFSLLCRTHSLASILIIIMQFLIKLLPGPTLTPSPTSTPSPLLQASPSASKSLSKTPAPSTALSALSCSPLPTAKSHSLHNVARNRKSLSILTKHLRMYRHSLQQQAMAKQHKSRQKQQLREQEATALGLATNALVQLIDINFHRKAEALVDNLLTNLGIFSKVFASSKHKRTILARLYGWDELFTPVFFPRHNTTTSAISITYSQQLKPNLSTGTVIAQLGLYKRTSQTQNLFNKLRLFLAELINANMQHQQLEASNQCNKLAHSCQKLRRTMQLFSEGAEGRGRGRARQGIKQGEGLKQVEAIRQVHVDMLNRKMRIRDKSEELGKLVRATGEVRVNEFYLREEANVGEIEMVIKEQMRRR